MAAVSALLSEFMGLSLVQFIGWVATIVGTVIAVRQSYRRRMHHQGDTIADQQRIIQRQAEENEGLQDRIRDLEDALVREKQAAERFNPASWITAAAGERAYNNEMKAISHLEDGFQLIEKDLREAAVELAFHHLEHVPTNGAPALDQARRYASIADRLQPTRQSTEILSALDHMTDDLSASPELGRRTPGESNDGDDQLNAHLMQSAKAYATMSSGPDAERFFRALYRACDRQFLLGNYDVMLRMARRAARVAKSMDTSSTARILADAWIAQALCALGRSSEALPIGISNWERCKAHPSYGPDDPETLSAAHLVAQIRHSTGDSSGALRLAEEIWERHKAHPALGPDHISTLKIAYLVAQLRGATGNRDGALSLAEEVWERRKAHAELGPDHPASLGTAHLVAQQRELIGDRGGALIVAEEAWEKHKAHPALGPDHPAALTVAHLVAKLRYGTGDNSGALALAKEVWEKRKAHPSLGADHPATLSIAYLVAFMRNATGDGSGALNLAEATWESSRIHPSLGPEHPETFTSAHLVADLRRAASDLDGGLALAEETLKGRQAHGSLGPDHPDTVETAKLVERIRSHMRDKEAGGRTRHAADG